MAKEKTVAYCVGKYEEFESTCDGAPDGETELEQRACLWRDRCKSFNAYLARTGKAIDAYLEAGVTIDGDGNEQFYAYPKHGFNRFKSFCERLIKNDLSREKEAAIEEAKKRDKQDEVRLKRALDKRRRGPTALAKKKAAASLARRAKSRREELLETFDIFRRDLIEQVDGHTFVDVANVVGPGQLYVVDRLPTSGYLSIYCQVLRGWPLPVTCFKIRPASKSFDVRLPLTVDVLKQKLSKTCFQKLSPEIEVTGRFFSVVRKVDLERLGLFAETLAQLINDDVIVLPKVKERS